MSDEAFQDYYPDHLSHCYGCGKLNEFGHQIKTVWEGDETLTTYKPKPYHTAVPGIVYGGLLASLIDCHATSTAAAAMYKKENRAMDTEPSFRFLTGSLFVKYIKPTPIDCTLYIRGKVIEITLKTVRVEVIVLANRIITVKGEVVAVQVPDKYIANIIKSANHKTE